MVSPSNTQQLSLAKYQLFEPPSRTAWSGGYSKVKEFLIQQVRVMLGSTALLLLYSLFFCHPTFSSPSTEHFDNMITIKVGRYLQQEFYEVISDADGGIYLDIRDFLEFTELSEYTTLSINKGNITLFMSGNLFPDMKDRSIKKAIKTLNSIEINGRLYIDKEKISELLPLKGVKWLEEKYTLEISPDFTLPLENRVITEKRKREIEEDKNKKETFQEADMFMKEDRRLIDLGMLKMRYDIDDFGNSLKEEGEMEIEYSSQLLYGDFNIRQNLYASGKLEDISLKYPYILKEKTLTLGDNFIEGNDILGYDSKIRGMSISNNDYSVKRSGREITIRGEAPKNSMIELYQNGKVVDYQSVVEKEYAFTLEMRSQKDEFKIKVYDRNGVFIEEKRVNIMEGHGFLSQGEWDYNLFYGQNPQGENSAWDDLKYGISHGFTNNLSYSFDYYDTKDEDKRYRYTKHRAGYRFSNLVVPLLVNLSYYDSLEDSSEGYITEWETELLSHQFYYSYEHYSHLLAHDEGKDNAQEAEISGNYGRSDYFVRFSNKSHQSRTQQEYDTGLSYDITKAIRMNFDLGKNIINDTHRRSNYTGEIGFDAGQGDFIYNLDAKYDRERYSKWEYTAKVRKRLSEYNKYAYEFEVNYNKNEHFSLGINFEYKFNDFLKINYDYDSEREDMHKVGASYEKVIDLKKPLTPNNSKDPDNGYIEGTVFIDKNGNGKKEVDEHPIEGMGVGIGQNKVKTNCDGLFYLSNISPYRKNKLIYDYSDVMIDPTLSADHFQEIQLIPASGKKIGVGLVPLSLIMGSITLPQQIETKKGNKFFSYVEIIVEKEGAYYSSIKPEYDGFFVVQDLQPGTYALSINYLGSEKIKLEKNRLEVIVNSGETGHFYEGVDFKVSEIKNKND